MTELQWSKSVTFEDFGARVNPSGIRNNPLSVLVLQVGSSDLRGPDDKVPQAIQLAYDDVHWRYPRKSRRCCGSKMTSADDVNCSDLGAGPACSMPSLRISTSENGKAAARSTSSRSFECKPSPRESANAPNFPEAIIPRSPVFEAFAK